MTVVMVPAGVSSSWVGNAMGPTLVRSEKSNGRFTYNNSHVMNLNPFKIMKLYTSRSETSFSKVFVLY